MRQLRSVCFALGIAFFGLGHVVETVEAQPRNFWSVDLTGGLQAPLGDLAKVMSAGPNFGGAVRQQSLNIAVGISFDVDFLSGKTFEEVSLIPTDFPDARFFNYHLFGEYFFIDPRDSDWRVNLKVGGGGTTISTDKVLGRMGTQTNFSVDLGGHFGKGVFLAEAFWRGQFATSNTNGPLPPQFDSLSGIVLKAGFKIKV